MISRRGFLLSGLVVSASALFSPKVRAAPPPGVTVLDAPLELAGDWGGMYPESVLKVLEISRRSCLAGVRLVSDRQPTRIWVERRTKAGTPAIWLHPDGSTTAWVVVNASERAWIQLSYQFGHELGHVLCNSWQAHAQSMPPCQWLEEALVAAFSIRGLGLLADNWRSAPPFPDDSKYADPILAYRDRLVSDFTNSAEAQGCLQDFGGWFNANREAIEQDPGEAYSQAASIFFLREYENSEGCIEALGALNRWPRRSAVPLADYLRFWEESCVELGADPALPKLLREVLGPVTI